MDRGPNYAALNHRQRTFVDGVHSGKSYTQAARDAGYSDKSAARQGVALSQNPKVLAALAEVRGPDIASVDEIQRMMTAVARGTFVAPDGKEICKPFISDMRTGVDLAAGDRLKALDMLAKSRGLYVTKVEHSGGVAVADTGPDISKWPLEVAEEYIELMTELAQREAAIVAKADAMMKAG